MVTPLLINDIKRRLVNLYDPVEIYLFGSYAWGLPTEESDLDLLIIVDTCNPKDRYAAMAAGHRALLGIRNIAKDIVVLSRVEFADASSDPARMFYKIRNEGKRIYARA